MVTKIFKRILFLSIIQWATFGLYSQSPESVDITLPMALFTDITHFEEGQKDLALLKQISDLIKATPAGEEITVCVFKFELETLAQDLIEAQQRGVKIRIILNKGDTSKDTNKEVKDLLQKHIEDFHYIENEITDKGIIHNKFILFSRIASTAGPIPLLVLQTSSNFQKKGAKKLQDMLILKSPELYYCFLDFWFEIKVLARAGELDNFDHFSCTDNKENKVFFFPKRRDGESRGPDNVLRVLKKISHPEKAQIRFAHGKWDENREELAEALGKLKEEGALVEVVTNGEVDKDVQKELKGLEEGIQYLDESFKMHTKFFLIQDGDKKQVWTGSHNLTERSLRENFEVLLKVEDQAVYESYLKYFNEIKALDIQ